jgi:hypothetical protein
MLHCFVNRYTVLVVISLSLSGIVAECRAELTDDDLDQLGKICRPSIDELAWRSLPWMTDLWQARERAARVGKPILLWVMDGHPLGCT